jgi:chromosome segregation ATPase
MPKSEATPLLNAATEFDEALALYARLGQLFIKQQLSSVKHLERANQILGEIADCEQRLQEGGKALITALSAARATQEQLAAEVVEHAPQVQARNQRLKELMTEMGQLATDAAAVSAQVVQKPGETEAAAPDPGAVSESVLALSARAEQLSATARDSEFEEVATQAHSLHQRLKAIAQKLQRAALTSN